MKKLMVFMARFGLGLILLIGGVENSLAQGKDSLFERPILLDDSLKDVSKYERPKNNIVYGKPGPAKPEKVAGEFVFGWVAALSFGALGASLGHDMTYSESSGDWLNFSGVCGAITGYLIFSNFGCAAGVYEAGNSNGEEGSYPATLGGSIAGTAVGAGIIALFKHHSDNDDASRLRIAAMAAAQAAGATLCFNLSRKTKKTEDFSQAFLNLREGKLSLAFPQVSVSKGFYNATKYNVNLFQTNF